MKENTGQVLVQAPPEIANYLLNEKRRALIEIEKERLGSTHAETGRDVLAHWKLPRLYAECVWCHHAPLMILDEEQLRIAGVVHVANILTHMSCIGSSGNHFPQRVTNALLKQFALRPDRLDTLMLSVPLEIDSICDDIGIGKGGEGLFRLVNRASIRLFDTFMTLKQRTQSLETSQRRSTILVRLLGELNAATRISEALERSATLLIGEGLARAFLGGLKAGELNLVCEARQDAAPRFMRASDSEIKGMLVSGDYPSGTRFAGGTFVYLDVLDSELAEDHAFISSVTEAIAACLRRIYIEDVRREEEGLLRQALASASQEKLNAENMLLLTKELMDASSVGLCLLDEHGRVRIENERAHTLRANLGASGEIITAALEKVAGEAPSQVREAILKRSGADLVWEAAGHGTYRVVVRPVTVNGWVLLTLWDITGDLEQQRRMVSYAKMSAVGNLAASMAHNMKSPLGALQGFASIIQDDLKGGRIKVYRGESEDIDFQDMITNMLTASENVLAIVNQLMGMTRKWETPPGDTDLEGFAERVFQVVGPQAASAGVSLKRELHLKRARVKSQALEQVLINLLINAISASSHNQEVSLKISQEGAMVVMRVIDHGIGMEASQLDRIFDPLYTNWPSRTGMGLGLALARDIVESMGGRIEVSSAPGEGSVFSLHVPVGESD